MIISIADNVVFVSGASCSAVYDFNTQKVYSLNQEATNILKKYLNKSGELSTEDLDFVSKVTRLFNLEKLENVPYVPNCPEDNLDFAWLEITQKCNCRCIHCYQGQNHTETSSPLDYSKWEDVLRQLSSLGCKSIQFIGGEPSTCEFLPRLICFAKSVGIVNISMFSNLNHLSNELIDVIIANNVHVHFSIYGSNKLTHENITTITNSFESMLKNVELLLKSDVTLTAHVVIMKQNEYDRDRIYSLLKSLGISDIKSDEIRKVFGLDMNKYLLNNPTSVMRSPDFKCSKDYFDKAAYVNTCWHRKIVVSTNGNVYPCEFERNIVYGNVLKNSIYEIISSFKTKECWKISFAKVERCKDCEFRFACKDCRPLAFAENGNLFHTSPRCSYNPYTGVWH